MNSTWSLPCPDDRSQHRRSSLTGLIYEFAIINLFEYLRGRPGPSQVAEKRILYVAVHVLSLSLSISLYLSLPNRRNVALRAYIPSTLSLHNGHFFSFISPPVQDYRTRKRSNHVKLLVLLPIKIFLHACSCG